MQMVCFGQLADFLHVARLPGKMHRKNGAGAGSNFSFRIARAEVQRLRKNVDKYGPRAEIRHHFGGSSKRCGWDQNLVSGLKPNRLQAEMQRGGAGGNRNRMRRPDVAGEAALEFQRFGPRGEPSRAHHVGDRAHFFFADAWPVKRNLNFYLCVHAGVMIPK